MYLTTLESNKAGLAPVVDSVVPEGPQQIGESIAALALVLWRANKPGEAKRILEHLVQYDPRYFHLHAGLTILAAIESKRREALNYLEFAMERLPENSVLHVHLKDVLERNRG